MDCNGCKGKQEQTERVSKFTFEIVEATHERTIKRFFIIVLVLITLLIVETAFLIWQEKQFESVQETKITQDVDTGEGSAYLSGTGDVIYGQSETDNNDH